MLQIKTQDIHKILAERLKKSESVEKKVSKIISDVERNRDVALRYWTKKLDGVDIEQFSVSEQEIKSAIKKITPSDRKVIKHAIERITRYHKKQFVKQFTVKERGIEISFKTKPIEKAGIYIPGGTFPLVSTVLMTAIPAKVAGVKEIIACSPPSYNGSIHPYIIGTLAMLEIRKIFKVGGSQAIAAMAYGTESIPKVNFIAGPGNIYVNCAKKILTGKVGIDLLAGPSELVALVDESANADFIATDLNAQAEHSNSIVFLLSFDKNTGEQISRRVNQGYWMKIDSVEEAIEIINTIAPEHLQIVCKNPEKISESVVAGAIFIGNYSPCAIGDYIAGPSHTLPTGSSASFDSGLNVFDFIRSYAVIKANWQFFKKNGIIAERIAEIENLFGHQASIKIRRENIDPEKIVK